MNAQPEIKYSYHNGRMKWGTEETRTSGWECVSVGTEEMTIAFGGGCSVTIYYREKPETFLRDGDKAQAYIAKHLGCDALASILRAVTILVNGPDNLPALPPAPPPPPLAFHVKAYYCNWVFYTGYWVKKYLIEDGKANGDHYLSDCLKWDTQQRPIWQAVRDQVGIELPEPQRHGHDFAKAFFHQFPGGLVFEQSQAWARDLTWFPHSLPPTLPEVAQWPIDRGE